MTFQNINHNLGLKRWKRCNVIESSGMADYYKAKDGEYFNIEYKVTD